MSGIRTVDLYAVMYTFLSILVTPTANCLIVVQAVPVSGPPPPFCRMNLD